MPILEVNWKRAYLIHTLSFFEMLLSPSGDTIKVTLSKPEQLDFAYVYRYMSSIATSISHLASTNLPQCKRMCGTDSLS